MPVEKEGVSQAGSQAGAQGSAPLKRFRPGKIAIIALVILLVVGGPAGFLIYEQRSFDDAFGAVNRQGQLCLENAAGNAG